MIFCKEAEEDEDGEDVFRETKASRPEEDPAVLIVRPDNRTLGLSSFLGTHGEIEPALVCCPWSPTPAPWCTCPPSEK